MLKTARVSLDREKVKKANEKILAISYKLDREYSEFLKQAKKGVNRKTT
jgi:hypothetical protein